MSNNRCLPLQGSRHMLRGWLKNSCSLTWALIRSSHLMTQRRGEKWKEFKAVPHGLHAVHWDHEPRTSRTMPPTRCCRCPFGRAFLGFLCRQDAGSTLAVHGKPSCFVAVHRGIATSVGLEFRIQPV